MAAELLLELNFWEMSLTHENVSDLIISLAKLQIENTRFITYPLRDHIIDNFDDFCEDEDRLFKAIVYLPEL